jgi:hypothetical protein
MLEEEIYGKEKKYLRFINLLIILNIFMAVVVVVIYLNIKEPSVVTGRRAVGQMPSNLRILPVTDMHEAKNRTLRYIDALDLKGLSLKRIISFKKYYYIYVKEITTDKTAFALKLIKLGTFSSKKFPSLYPQMMWNLKYGHVAKRNVDDIEPLMLTLGDARKVATDVTNKLGASYSLNKNPDVYYGFYEFIVFQNKVAVGEVSINGRSGKVFFKMYPTPPLEFSEFI